MNGSRLIAGCFRFIFGSRYAESTRSKFGDLAYSRINTVYLKLVDAADFKVRLIRLQVLPIYMGCNMPEETLS